MDAILVCLGKTVDCMALGIIMFGMGLTLEAEDFKQVWENRRLVVAGVTLQYTMMPLLAWALVWLSDYPTS